MRVIATTITVRTSGLVRALDAVDYDGDVQRNMDPYHPAEALRASQHS